MKTLALLILLLACAAPAAEVVGVPWTYPTAQSAGVNFILYHRATSAGEWKAITIVPSTEVAERGAGVNTYEVAVQLQDGPHEFAVKAVKATRPSPMSNVVTVVIGASEDMLEHIHDTLLRIEGLLRARP